MSAKIIPFPAHRIVRHWPDPDLELKRLLQEIFEPPPKKPRKTRKR